MIKTQFAKCGNRGPKGEKGTDGLTPTIGANGNWFIGDKDTGLPSRGPRGFNGPPVNIVRIWVSEEGHLMIELTE